VEPVSGAPLVATAREIWTFAAAGRASVRVSRRAARSGVDTGEPSGGSAGGPRLRWRLPRGAHGPIRALGASRWAVVAGLSAGVAVIRGAGAGGGRSARRRRLDGRAASALAVGAGGRRVWVAQGRRLWRGSAAGWQRLGPLPGLRRVRLLAAHPTRPGWLLGSDGQAVVYSRDGGRSWRGLPAPSGTGFLSGIRFSGCPRPGRRASPRAGAGVLLRAGSTVWATDIGAAPSAPWRRMVLGGPVVAAVGAAGSGRAPARWVLSDRLYRWRCGAPAPRAVGPLLPSEPVALARGRAGAGGRLWILTRDALWDRPARAPGRRARRAVLAGCALASPVRRPARGLRWPASAGAGARWWPRLGVSLRGGTRRALSWRRQLGETLARRRAPRLELLITLSWPLAAARDREPALVALRRRARGHAQRRARALGRLWCAGVSGVGVSGAGVSGAGLQRWARVRIRAALAAHFRQAHPPRKGHDPRPAEPRPGTDRFSRKTKTKTKPKEETDVHPPPRR
jgi:hypothetical protein